MKFLARLLAVLVLAMIFHPAETARLLGEVLADLFRLYLVAVSVIGLVVLFYLSWDFFEYRSQRRLARGERKPT